MLNEKGLAPCPFCGSGELMLFCDPDEGRGNSGPSRRIQCAGCNIEAPFYDTEVDAISAWNRRASPEAPEDVAGVKPVAWRYADPRSGIWHYVQDYEPVRRENRQPLYPASALARVAAEAATLRARIAELEADATADDIEAAARGMYGSKWGSPKDDERPGEKMKDVWRKYAADAIKGYLAIRALKEKQP